MAQLNFPDNPIDGQLYPNPCPQGVIQYRWDVSTGIWRIVGVATGVNSGTYGDSVTVGQFTVDVQGIVTDARNVPIADASTEQQGIVKLTDSLTTISSTLGLTATAGRNLQGQIGDLNSCLVPDHTTVVNALNSLQRQADQLNEGALIWCGYYNAEEGDITYVSLIGQKLGYRIGQELPTPGPDNAGDMFIVLKAGNPYIAGDYNAPNVFVEVGNWIVSERVRWSEVDATGGPVQAKDVVFQPSQPLTATNVQGALYQITQLFRTGIGGATISETKPLNPYPGQLWWDNDDGIFYIYYTDQNSQQWVEAGGGNTGNLTDGGGGIYLINTGVGLSGGPITSSGTISLEPAFIDKFDFNLSRIGGVIPNVGFDYSNTTGILDLKITSDFTGKDPQTAFSQEGANILNSKIDQLSGANVLAGTYDASLGQLVFATPAGTAKGFVAGQNLPIPSAAIDNYYVIVTVGGNQGPGVTVEAQPGDWWICEGQDNPPVWFLINYDTPGTTASGVSVVPIPGIEQATNVQSALGLLELQSQDRIEFVETTSDGVNIVVSKPGVQSYDGTTLSIGLDYASVDQRGIVQLTSDVRGSSDTLAVTQAAVSAINAKIDAVTGANILAGTYNSNTGTLVSVTPAGQAAGLQPGQQALPSDQVPDNYYLIVVVGGGFGPPGATLPPSGVQSGDWFINERAQGTGTWVTIDYENRTTVASQVGISPIPYISATDVQGALAQIQTEVMDAVVGVTAGNDGISVQLTPVNADVGYIANLTLNPANQVDIGGVYVPDGFGIGCSGSGGIYLIPPTADTLGGVKQGENIVIDADGTINATVPAVKPPTQLDPLPFDGITTTFTLRVDGVPITPTNSVSVLIALGGIIQTAGDAYTVTGSSINFASAPNTAMTFYGVAFAYS